MIRTDRHPRLTPGTEWSAIEFTSEPFVVVTFRGYTAACDVRAIDTGLDYTLLMGAKSLSDALEELRQARSGFLLGLRVAIKKVGNDRTAPYAIRLIES